MSIFGKQPRVSVTVTGDVDVSVAAREDEFPLPPLPKRELPPFAEKPICSGCRSTRVGFEYWPRYHDGCASGFYVPAPFLHYGLGTSPEQERERQRQWAETYRRRNTMPRHIDLRCERCAHHWVMAAAEEAEAA